ncbi:ABC transporter ATP-binding protein [Streptomyces bomunensis]|uniref:ABC transporter ATP-binding protein n=2 Tax=Streptomyces montanisoli TaxID=2798581 RepID=A0A940MFJ4_9ACTN|nr:ABC transporter ATP-binding protein [Streptomyces montanisoli]
MSYGQHDVLKGLDLTVEKGQLFVLLGPNGAGKTTTIEIMEGYAKPTGGSASVLGSDPLTAGDAWRDQVGIVMQSWADHASWRLDTLLGDIASYYSDPYPTAELLELVGLGEHRRRRLNQLSGGQRRRMDVALGLVGHPRVLFLDEPTAGFDPQARADFHRVISGLKSEGVTIVLTTHDLQEAERLADRIGILLGGVIHTDSTPAELAQSIGQRTQVSWTAKDGARRTEATDDPDTLVHELMTSNGGPLTGLRIDRPSLEEIYMDIVEAAR